MKNFKNTLEVVDEIVSCRKNAISIVELAKAEKRELTAEEQEQYDAIKTQVAELEQVKSELEAKLNEEVEGKNDESKEDEKENEERNMNTFSLLSAINKIVNNRQLDEKELEVVNRGIEIMRKSGQSYAGQIVMPIENRGISAGTATKGQEVVAEDILDILPVLRDNDILSEFTWLTGLTGDVSIPTYSGSSAKWEGETTNDTTDAAGTFGEVKFSPKRLTATLAISKQFLIQDSAKAEEMLRKDIVNAITDKLQKTILGDGDGTTGVKGLFNGVAIDTAAVKFADIVNLEATVEANNIGEGKYIVSPTAKATLRTTTKDSGSGKFVMDGGEIEGKEVLSTNAVNATAGNKGVIYGDLKEYVVAQWGAIDLTVDPYSLAGAGQIKLVVNAYFDAKPRRTGALVAKILK